MRTRLPTAFVKVSIDYFFRSLALDQGERAIGIILSGTGTDGTLGLKAIKSELGMTMVQDPDSAKYNGMPRSAVQTSMVDYVLPVEEMPEHLIKYAKLAVHRVEPGMTPVEGEIPEALPKIFILLRAHTGHDFSLYKKNTLYRRIERRMGIHQINRQAVRRLRSACGKEPPTSPKPPVAIKGRASLMA